MRILVTGAFGMVGSYAQSVFSDAKCILTDRHSLNICKKDEVLRLFEQLKPDIVLHLAAATDVDKCELEPDWAFQVNVSGSENVAVACKLNNAVLVFLSSGAVFDGTKPQPYIESDKVSPVNVYGKTKAEAEKIIASVLKSYYIIRAGWIVGGGKKDIKFVGKVIAKMRESNRLKAVDDKFGSLTYAKDLLSGIKSLIRIKPFGLYHMVNPGMVSRYDIALEIKNILSLDDIEISPVSSGFFPMPAPRGRSEALENVRLSQVGLDLMRNWKDALRDYLLNDYEAILYKGAKSNG